MPYANETALEILTITSNITKANNVIIKESFIINIGERSSELKELIYEFNQISYILKDSYINAKDNNIQIKLNLPKFVK